MDKWEILGYVAAIFSPLPTGLLAGYFLFKEKKYKKTGINVLAISIIIMILLLFFL